MPNSIISSEFYTECDELAESIKQSDVEMIQIDKGKLSASLYHIDFSKLDVQFGKISGARVIETGRSSREYFGFLYDLNYQMPTITDGYEIDKYSFTFYPPNTEHCSVGSKRLLWVYVCIKNDEKFIELIEEMKLPMSSSTRFCCYDDETVENMHNLFHQVVHLTQYNPHYFDSPEASRYFENEIIDAQISLLLKSNKVQKNQSSRARSHVLTKKFIEYIRRGVDSNRNISDFCAEFGVSLRSLYYAFEDIFRVSPYKYIKIFKLNKAHRQLLNSDPNRHSVWRTAHQNGFNHLGRFSVDYKKIFGKSPSETLKIVK